MRKTAITLLRLDVLLFAGMFLSACHANADDVNGSDIPGYYVLATVIGEKLPTTVSRGDEKLRVRRGHFIIKADGGCNNRVVFARLSGDDFTRSVNGSCTRNGSELNIQWYDAGQTEATIEGDSFKINDQGVMYVYKYHHALDTTGFTETEANIFIAFIALVIGGITFLVFHGFRIGLRSRKGVWNCVAYGKVIGKVVAQRVH